MDADEVLTGKKKNPVDNQMEEDELFWHTQKPLSKEELEYGLSREKRFRIPNPKPIVRIFDAPKRDNKFGKGLMVGLEWSF